MNERGPKSSQQRFSLRARLPAVFSGVVGLALCCGCWPCREGQGDHAARQGYVSVGSIRWDRADEQQEIRATLASHGVVMDIWGSKMYSILVPKEQGMKAYQILKTNHLVLEEKMLVTLPLELR